MLYELPVVHCTDLLLDVPCGRLAASPRRAPLPRGSWIGSRGRIMARYTCASIREGDLSMVIEPRKGSNCRSNVTRQSCRNCGNPVRLLLLLLLVCWAMRTTALA